MKTTDNREQRIKNKGQTVLELLVALSLIIFFLLGVVVLEVFSIKNIQYAQNKTVATKLARQQLERARVVRDSSGIDSLNICQSPCYINNQLTPAAITPTGIYGQSFTVSVATSDDCPLPTADPPPVAYKARAYVSWGQGAQITPAKEIEISSCITDWR